MVNKNSHVICNKCKSKIKDMPFKCKYCGKYYCSKHRLPEDHGCKKLGKTKKWKVNRTSSGSKNFKIYHKPKHTTPSVKYEPSYEMYQPSRKRHSFNLFKKFGLKDLTFRIPRRIEPYFMRFLLIFIIGVVLDFVYYQTFSLQYLFIGGVNDWFNVLIATMNGFSQNYDIFYLVINGFYYFYFYSAFTMLIFKILKNLHKKKIWVFLGWMALIIYLILRFIPQIV